MKLAKWFLCFVVVGFAGVGAIAIIFPRGHANPNISEDDAADLAAELGISVGTQGSEGGISAVFGGASGIPSLKATSGGDDLPSFMTAGSSAPPAMIAAVPSPPVASPVATPVLTAAPIFTTDTAFAAPAEMASPVVDDAPVPPEVRVPVEIETPIPATISVLAPEPEAKLLLVSLDMPLPSKTVRALPPVDDTDETSRVILASLSLETAPKPVEPKRAPKPLLNFASEAPEKETPVAVTWSLPATPPLTQEMPRETVGVGSSFNALRGDGIALHRSTENAENKYETVVSEKNTESGEKLRNKVVRYIQAQCVLVDSGEPRKVSEAYAQLSRLYEHPEINSKERNVLEPILEQLATDIIYSPDTHILEPPHTVVAGETINSIAAEFEISPQLLMRINEMSDASELRTGMQLKVFHGPFDAKVLVGEKKLYIVLGGLYAGRAEVTSEMPLCHTLEGAYQVREKSVFAPGVLWIGLGNDIGLISTNQPDRIKSQTVFVLPTVKMAELHDLLQLQSTVSIVRASTIN